MNACSLRAQELCESRGGRPGLPNTTVLMVCGRKATLKLNSRKTVPREMDNYKPQATTRQVLDG